MRLFYREDLTEIYCGDVLDVLTSLPGESVDLIAFSPPYNVRIRYDGCSDEMPWNAHYEFMTRVIRECYRILFKGGTIAINIPSVVSYQHDHQYNHTWADYDGQYKTHRVHEKVVGRGRMEPIGFRLFNILQSIDPHLREPIVWVKGESPEKSVSINFQMGSDSNPHLRSTYKLILLGSKERWYHRGGTGRRGGGAVPFEDYTKDVWFIPPARRRNHPAPWPKEIPSRLIKLFVHASNGVVLDPFMGCGTTLEAAREFGLKNIGIDISPAYCEIASEMCKEYNSKGK